MRKYRNHNFFIYIFLFSIFLGGWGWGGGSADVVKKTSCNRRTKFRNTHWSDKSLTNVEDKPWK